MAVLLLHSVCVMDRQCHSVREAMREAMRRKRTASKHSRAWSLNSALAPGAALEKGPWKDLRRFMLSGVVPLVHLPAKAVWMLPVHLLPRLGTRQETRADGPGPTNDSS